MLGVGEPAGHLGAPLALPEDGQVGHRGQQLDVAVDGQDGEPAAGALLVGEDGAQPAEGGLVVDGEVEPGLHQAAPVGDPGLLGDQLLPVGAELVEGQRGQLGGALRRPARRLAAGDGAPPGSRVGRVGRGHVQVLRPAGRGAGHAGRIVEVPRRA